MQNQHQRLKTYADVDLRASGNYTGNAGQKSFRRSSPINPFDEELRKVLEWNKKQRPRKGKRTDSNISVRTTNSSALLTRGSLHQKLTGKVVHQKKAEEEPNKLRQVSPLLSKNNLKKQSIAKISREKEMYHAQKQRIDHQVQLRIKEEIKSPFRNERPSYSNLENLRTPQKQKIPAPSAQEMLKRKMDPVKKMTTRLAGTTGTIQIELFAGSIFLPEVIRLNKEIQQLKDEREKYEKFFTAKTRNPQIVILIAQRLDSCLSKLKKAFQYYDQLVDGLLEEE